MASMSRGDRVAHASNRAWAGTLDGDPDKTGTVRVAGDGGWTGRLHVDTLTLLEDNVAERIVCPEHGIPDCSPLLNGCSKVIEAHRAAEQPREDKSWPPRGIEHK